MDGDNPVSRRRALLALAGSCAAGMAWRAPRAAPSTWTPTHPLRLVVTYPPGGGADVTARAMTEALGERLGQPVVVENRGGAGGMVGTASVFRAAPDGYTLLWGNTDTMAMAPNLYRQINYVPEEFTALAPVVALGFVLASRPTLEAQDFRQLIELARKRQLSFASWGVGSPGHVGSEMLKNQAGIPSILNVPYRGTAPACQALLAGEVDVMYLPSPLWLAFRKQVRTYAIAAPKRYTQFQDIPTMAELGVPVDMDVWQGLFAPPGTPLPIAERIHEAVTQAVGTPDVQKRFLELGGVPLTSSRAAFAQSIPTERARWGALLRAANVQPQD
ncbi:Bug family tripartite tricarboxylate transporter substrate binding protein [Bordetella bronchialis]|uniref:Bug family tripartite tricarboxylate transporter substrate binding protein n=1 Tax=Bordetella bronchialis TaxID=463025 RepID=UPI003D031FEE